MLYYTWCSPQLIYRFVIPLQVCKKKYYHDRLKALDKVHGRRVVGKLPQNTDSVVAKHLSRIIHYNVIGLHAAAYEQLVSFYFFQLYAYTPVLSNTCV